MRRAFSLMVTLSTLAALIALTSVMLGYFSQTKQDADTTKALIQANVFYADIQHELRRLKGKQIKQIYRYPLSLVDESNRFILQLRCQPVNKGININWLAYENDTKFQNLYQEAHRLYDFLSQNYQIREPSRLLEMIQMQIVSSGAYLRRPQSRLRQKKGIISYRQFADVITRYIYETDDHRANIVPWSRYFSFSAIAKKIEIEYASAELIAYVFDLDLQTVYEWFAMSAQERPTLQVFVDQSGGFYEEKSFLFATDKDAIEAHCDVNFKGGSGMYGFGFDYIGNEAKYFEFYAKQ